MKGFSPPKGYKEKAGRSSRCRGEQGNANIAVAVIIALLLVVLLFGRKLGLSSDLLALLYPQPTIQVKADAWKVLALPDRGFTVEMPGDPEITTRSGQLEGRTVAVRQYRVNSEGKYQFTVGTADVREVMQGRNIDPETALGAYVQGLIKTAQGKVVSESPIRLDLFPGREILVKTDGMMSRLRLYVTNAHLYSVEARSTRKFVTSADADRFFASFKFTGNALSGSPADLVWKDFTPVYGGFSVQMPGVPTDRKETFRSGAADVTLYLFELQRGKPNDNDTVSVQYMDYTEQRLKELRTANEVLKKAATVDAYNIGGTVVSERSISLGRYPGRELQVENAERAMRIRIYLVDRRLYKVTAAWPKSRAFSAEDERFLNSFQLSN